MFNYLYKSYKLEVLKTNIWISIKQLKLYEKVFLVMIFLGAILATAFSLTENTIGSMVSIILIFAGFVLMMIFQCRKVEQRRILDEIIEPSANDRMEKVIKLLQKFDIDVTDEKQLDSIITLAKKEKEAYDVWKGIRKLFGGMTTYVLLPIMTIFLAEFFKNNTWQELLVRAILLLLVCLGIVLLVSAFAMNLDDVFNPDVRNLNYFIRDIEDVKAFSEKAKNFIRIQDQ